LALRNWAEFSVVESSLEGQDSLIQCSITKKWYQEEETGLICKGFDPCPMKHWKTDVYIESGKPTYIIDRII
jgi:hypothetical protein